MSKTITNLNWNEYDNGKQTGVQNMQSDKNKATRGASNKLSPAIKGNKHNSIFF